QRRARPAARGRAPVRGDLHPDDRSEEHTSELQSRENLVCRLLLEKKKINRVRRIAVALAVVSEQLLDRLQLAPLQADIGSLLVQLRHVLTPQTCYQPRVTPPEGSP